jgi:hypothetical protein
VSATGGPFFLVCLLVFFLKIKFHLHFFGGDDILLDKLLRVDGQGGRVLLNLVVHARLRELGLVRLIVPVAAVADNVDHHVRAKLLRPQKKEKKERKKEKKKKKKPRSGGERAKKAKQQPSHKTSQTPQTNDGLTDLAEADGNVDAAEDSLGIVTVDMHDGRVDHLCNVRAVLRGAGKARVSGEANLVVDHDVHGTAGAVCWKLRQTKRLVDHSLPGKRGVAVDQHRHNLGARLFLNWHERKRKRKRKKKAMNKRNR